MGKSIFCLTLFVVFFSAAGTTQTKTSGPDADSDPLTEEKAGFPEASAGPPEKGPTLNEEPPGPEPRFGALSMEIFHSRIACLPGPQGL